MNTPLIEERTAYRWLARLQRADPDCDLLKRSIAQIEDRHPDWHPYPPNQSETEDFQSENASYPRSPDELLSMPGDYWADKLASSLPHDPAHRTLLSPQTQEAVKRNPSWGIDLARATIDANLIKNPAWYYIITGWDQSDLTESQQSSVLDIIADPQLQSNHGDTIAEHLYKLVRHGGKSYAFKLLHQAESVAKSLWPHMKTDTPPSQPESWVEHAIGYYGVGYLPLFWINAASVRSRHEDRVRLGESCKQSLNQMLQETSTRGFLAQSVITSQTAFLLRADEDWTARYVIPMFKEVDQQRAVAVWEGFLGAQNLNEQTAEHLGQTIHTRLPEISEMMPTTRNRQNLARCYATALCYYALQPSSWMKETAGTVDDDISALITTQIQYRIRQADQSQQADWWSRWLKSYWTDRNRRVPRPLGESEANALISWTPHLVGAYVEAAELAAGTEIDLIDPLILAELAESPAAREHPKTTADLLRSLYGKTRAKNLPVEWISVRQLIVDILGSLEQGESISLQEILSQIEHRADI